MAVGDFAADDGVLSTSAEGLVLAAGGRSPQTGEPAFTKEADGTLDHLKWLAFTRERFEIGPGTLRCTYGIRCRTFGMAEQPYGAAVADPASDLRLGCTVVNAIDFTTGMNFGFSTCAGAVYPYYERVQMPGSDLETFVSLAKPVTRNPSDIHEFVLEFDAPAGTVSWQVDGRQVASVTNIGLLNEGWDTVLAQPGRSALAPPAGVSVGVGLLDLLDASLPPSEQGLVDLGMSYEHPRSFAGGPHLFGQGVEALITGLEVTRA